MFTLVTPMNHSSFLSFLLWKAQVHSDASALSPGDDVTDVAEEEQQQQENLEETTSSALTPSTPAAPTHHERQVCFSLTSLILSLGQCGQF